MKKTFLKNKKNIQFLIIGLGLIGGSVAKRLSKNGFEVLAIDKNKSRLNYAKKYQIKSEIILNKYKNKQSGLLKDLLVSSIQRQN